eukprot:1938140-Rhodomonas_salina.1
MEADLDALHDADLLLQRVLVVLRCDEERGARSEERGKRKEERGKRKEERGKRKTERGKSEGRKWEGGRRHHISVEKQKDWTKGAEQKGRDMEGAEGGKGRERRAGKEAGTEEGTEGVDTCASFLSMILTATLGKRGSFGMPTFEREVVQDGIGK